MPFLRARDKRALDAAIASFRKEPAPGETLPRTLLLLLKQGANGLNLTGAHAPPPVSPSVLTSPLCFYWLGATVRQLFCHPAVPCAFL